MPTLTLQRSHSGLRAGPPKSNLAGLFSQTASRNYLLWPPGAPHLDASSNLKSHVTPFRKASLTILSFRSCWACAADTCYSHFQFPLPHLPRAALWLLRLPRGFLAGKGRRVRPRGAGVTPDFSTLPKATSSSQGGPFKPGHGGLQPVLTTDAAFCVLPPFLAHVTANSPAVKLSLITLVGVCCLSSAETLTGTGARHNERSFYYSSDHTGLQWLFSLLSLLSQAFQSPALV